MLTDAHAHLNDAKFDGEVDEAIQRARDSRVVKIINAAWDRGSAEKALELAEKYDECYFTVGVHPHQAKDVVEQDYYRFKELAKHPKCVAYGEIGLDYHYDFSPRDVQRAVFDYQIQVAFDLSLPLVLHLREAYGDANQILDKNRKLLTNGVLLHCYGGSMELARDYYNKLDCYYSFGGAVTFKNANKGDVLRTIPKNRLLLETDCPYMTPVPLRGQRNEPANLPLIRDKIAFELSLSPEEVEDITYSNFSEFYKVR